MTYQDNKDWERLTEGEQHFVKHVLAFLCRRAGAWELGKSNLLYQVEG